MASPGKQGDTCREGGSVISFGLPPRKLRRINRLYKVGNVKVYAPSKVEARRRFMVYHGVTEIRKAEKVQ